jgi:hypothetical protein
MARKTVAIRGLDTELYHEVFSMAKKDGKKVSDVVNVALKAFIDGDYEELPRMPNLLINNANPNDFILSIDDDGEISLSKNDIIEISDDVGPFTIQTSGNLVLEKDVDREALKRINGIIIKAGNVKIPRKSYPSFLMKAQISGSIEKY